MADIFLRSTTGSDANGGTDKGSPKATLVSALTAAGSGGRVFVSDTGHAETQGSAMSITGGTSTSPIYVICVPDWGAATGTTAPTSRSTGASVATTGGNGITFGAQYIWYYGLTFKSGSGSSTSNLTVLNAVAGYIVFDSCNLQIVHTNTSGRLQFGSASGTPSESAVDLIGTAVSFASASQQILLNSCRVRWSNTATFLGAGSVPGTVFSCSNAAVTNAELVGIDFSQADSGKTLFGLAGDSVGLIRVINCKLGASVTKDTGTIGEPQALVLEMVNCTSADANYEFYRRDYAATETHETTIVRSGGASDGTTAVSRQIATTANARPLSPYRSHPMLFWNETVGSVTVSIPVVTDGVTLTDAEAWLEVEYLGTSGVPLAGQITDRVSDPFFGSASNQATDGTSSWTTTGLASPVKQTLDVTFSPAEKGWISAVVCVAKASTTVYYDPKALSTSSRQYQVSGYFVNEGASSSGAGVNRAALPSGLSALG